MSELLQKCEVCRSLLDEEDMFCANCGTEAPHQTDRPQQATTTRQATYNFECSGCGASMSYDARAGSLRCPFCGSTAMVAQRDAKVLAPNRVVPFRLDQQSAIAAMRQWLAGRWFRPGGLSQQAAVVRMQPVYLPYWVFQAKTHTYWTADTSRTPPGARGNWYPLSGETHHEHGEVLIAASGALQPRETGALAPFDLSAGVAPEQVDLDNITVEQFALPRKYARPLVRSELEAHEQQRIAAELPGRTRNVHVNVQIESLSSEPVLLPVYIMAYRYRGEVYRFLVNGQTGRAVGEAPLSWVKILLIPAALIVIVLLLLLASQAFGAVAGPPSTPTLRQRLAAPATQSTSDLPRPLPLTAEPSRVMLGEGRLLSPVANTSSVDQLP